MDDAGDIAPAAAMAMMIVYTLAAVRILHALLTRGLARRPMGQRIDGVQKTPRRTGCDDG